MNDQVLRYYQRGRRVQIFGDDYSFDFATSDKTTTLFGDLDDVLARFDLVSADGSPDHIDPELLHQELRLDLKNIARTARELEREEPGFAAPYLLPQNTADGALLRHADVVLARLEEQPADFAAVKSAKTALRARFTAFELPADFVTDLRADREAINNAATRNASEDNEGTRNTEALAQLIRQMNTVIAGLNAVMHNKYQHQPEKLRAWRSAGHVERAPRRNQSPATPPPSGGAPTPN